MSSTSQLTLICATWAMHMAQPMMIAQMATAILDTVTRRAPLACTSHSHVIPGTPAHKTVTLHGGRLHTSHISQRASGACTLQTQQAHRDQPLASAESPLQHFETYRWDKADAGCWTSVANKALTFGLMYLR